MRAVVMGLSRIKSIGSKKRKRKARNTVRPRQAVVAEWAGGTINCYPYITTRIGLNFVSMHGLQALE
jgi:hypothetical protein